MSAARFLTWLVDLPLPFRPATTCRTIHRLLNASHLVPIFYCFRRGRGGIIPHGRTGIHSTPIRANPDTSAGACCRGRSLIFSNGKGAAYHEPGLLCFFFQYFETPDRHPQAGTDRCGHLRHGLILGPRLPVRESARCGQDARGICRRDKTEPHLPIARRSHGDNPDRVRSIENIVPGTASRLLDRS